MNTSSSETEIVYYVCMGVIEPNHTPRQHEFDYFPWGDQEHFKFSKYHADKFDPSKHPEFINTHLNLTTDDVLKFDFPRFAWALERTVESRGKKLPFVLGVKEDLSVISSNNSLGYDLSIKLLRHMIYQKSQLGKVVFKRKRTGIDTSRDFIHYEHKVNAFLCMGVTVNTKVEPEYEYLPQGDRYLCYSAYDCSPLTLKELTEIGYEPALGSKRLSLRDIYQWGLKNKGTQDRGFWVRCFMDEKFGEVRARSHYGLTPYLVVQVDWFQEKVLEEHIEFPIFEKPTKSDEQE
jgi:hypothetical protein